MTSSVQPQQRFSAKRPCPVCGGHKGLPQRGHGRCWGFLSDDGEHAHCTREQFAGGLSPGANGDYAHRLVGDCRCGHRHDGGLTPAGVAGVAEGQSRTPAGPPIRWPSNNADGSLFGFHARQDYTDGTKRVWWEDHEGRSSLDAPLYGIQRLAEADPTETVTVHEGEPATDAGAERGLLSVGTVCGAPSMPNDHVLEPLLRFGRIVLWPDADADGKGQRHMQRIAEWLAVQGAEDVRVVDWSDAPDKGDCADFTGTDEELQTLLDAALPVAEVDNSLSSSRAEKPSDVRRVVTGGTFILDAPPTVPALWGHDDEVLWAQSETMLLVGSDGVGKTTLAQNLILARLGILDGLLGMPVMVTDRKLIVIAADRPQQWVRSMRRMVGPEHREVLDRQLVIYQGPPPIDIVDDPASLRRFVRDHGADELYIDSLKDLVVGIAEDKPGAALNNSLQECLADGIDVCAIHHQRKEQRGRAAGPPTRLADVYGSRWITAGAGSVLLLWGEPGDLVVDLRHLKQPAAEVGPMKVLHDHGRGLSSVYEQADVLQVLRASTGGLTAEATARLMFETDSPTPSEKQKARRRLGSLVKAGLAREEPGR